MRSQANLESILEPVVMSPIASSYYTIVAPPVAADSAPRFLSTTDDDLQCTVAAKLSTMKPWYFALAAGCILLSFVLTLVLMSKISGEHKTKFSAYTSAGIAKLCGDINLVYLVVIPGWRLFFDSECKNTDLLDFISFIVTAFIYFLDILFDVNTLLWSLKYGVNAEDYDSSHYEGLERLNPIFQTLPGFGYIWASMTAIILSAGGGNQSGISVEHYLAFGVICFGLLIGLIGGLVYTNKHFRQEGQSFTEFWCLDCSNSMYPSGHRPCKGNTTQVPRDGISWGGLNVFSLRMELLSFGIAEVILAVAYDEPAIYVPSMAFGAASELVRTLLTFFRKIGSTDTLQHDGIHNGDDSFHSTTHEGDQERSAEVGDVLGHDIEARNVLC